MGRSGPALLVVVDRSAVSLDTVLIGVGLANCTGSSLIVLCLLRPIFSGSAIGAPTIPSPWVDQVLQEQAGDIRGQVASLLSLDPPVPWEFRWSTAPIGSALRPWTQTGAALAIVIRGARGHWRLTDLRARAVQRAALGLRHRPYVVLV
jgi:hypothetical protein